jgi:hypothetical protein
MVYNEIETKSLGKLKILAHIDNRALLEKMYDTPEKYIIATNFDIATKSWDFGSYYYSFQDAIEEFTERVLANRNIKSSIQKTTEELYDLSTRVNEIAHNIDNATTTEYLENQKEMEKLRYEFKNNAVNDKNLQEHFKNSKDRFFDIMIASTILGGIDLRNFQRDLDNLNEEKEKYPYNDEQIKMIDRYIDLEHRQEELENIVEEDMEL